MRCHPILSIVLMVDRQRERGARALRSLLAQDRIDRMEVLLYDAAIGEESPLPGSDHPSVRVLALPRGMGFGEARARAVSAAHAPIVAFIEEHAIMSAGWAEAICRAHADGWAGVGPEIIQENPGRGASDLVELYSLGPWTVPAKRGESSSIRWQNSSFNRECLLRYGDSLAELLDADGMLYRQLQHDGLRLYTEPDARLAHTNEVRLAAFCRGCYVNQRLAASTRATLLRWSLGRRVLGAGAALRLPLTLALGHLSTLSRDPARRRLYRLAWRRLPGFMMVNLCLTAGIIAGLLGGKGRSSSQFLDYELNQHRGVAGDREIDRL